MLVNREQLIQTIQNTFPLSQAPREEIEQIAEQAEVVFFEGEKIIYMEGAAAQYLYLVIEGNVEIIQEHRQQLIRLNHLYGETLFGEDALCGSHQRRTSARAVEDSILIKLNMQVIEGLIDRHDEIRDGFRLLVASYELLIEKPRLTFSEEETLYYLTHPHPFFFLVKGLSSLIIYSLLLGLGAILFLNGFLSASTLTGLIILFTFLFFLFVTWRFIEWRNDFCIFTNKRVASVDRMMLFQDIRAEIPLNAIVSLNIRKNFVGRSLAFGDLMIRTFTGVSRLKHMPDVDAAARYLDFLWKKNRQDIRRQERKAFEQALENGADLEDQFIWNEAGHLPATVANKKGGSSTWLNRLFRLKKIEPDRIIYHTHWAILLRKTIFPAFILVGAGSFFFYFYWNQFMWAQHRLFQILLAGFLIFGLLWWVYQYLDWRRDQYIITPNQIMDVDRKPLGMEDMRAAPIKNIQSIRYKRSGLLGLVLNFGTVYIRVGDDELTFDQVPDPAAVQQELFRSLERVLSQQKRADLTEQQQHMADWIASYFHNKIQDGL